MYESKYKIEPFDYEHSIGCFKEIFIEELLKKENHDALAALLEEFVK